MAADTAPVAVAPAKKGRKRRKSQVDESQLSQGELARRQRQRQLRAVALRVREQGSEYNPKRHKKHKPRRRVAVILIPIFWNRKLGEKNAVLEATEGIQAMLREAGVKCDTDTTNELTPGQKMRHWEEKGVMVRVEVGGKEAEAGAAVVALCTTPGEVAQKKTVAVGEPLLRLVKKHLEALGIPLQVPEGAANGAAQAEGGAAEAEEEAGQLQDSSQGQAGQEAAGQQQQQEERSGKKAQPGPSGDDLAGDFEAVPLLPQKESGKKGKQREQAAADAAAELAASVFGEGQEGGKGGKGSAGKKKKKPKTIQF